MFLSGSDWNQGSTPADISMSVQGCLVQVGNGIELEAAGLQFEPYRWRPCGVTWDSSRTVVVIKLRRLTSALLHYIGNIYAHGLDETKKLSTPDCGLPEL